MSAAGHRALQAGGDALAWLREDVRTLKPYVVPDREGYVLLDAMENPYPLPTELKAGWLARLECVDLNRYPDAGARVLKARIKETMGIPDGCGTLLGNGSDELIQLIALSVAEHDRWLLAPEPSFAMYRLIAAYTGLGYAGVALKADFSLDLEAMLARIESLKPAVIFLAYPNNPTGNCWFRSDVEAVIEAAPGLVVVDEAYAPFAQKSFFDVLPRHPRLLVMRTLSKLGLAGLRLGYLCGEPGLIAEIDKLRLPYNINSLSQASAEFALEHIDVFDAQAEDIRARRSRLVQALNEIPGFETYPSEANFVLFRTPPGESGRIFEALLKARVLIKNLSTPGLLRDCLRVTVGSESDQASFLAALRQALRTERA